MPTTTRRVAMFAALLMAASCSSPTPPEADVPAGAIRVIGTVTHYSAAVNGLGHFAILFKIMSASLVQMKRCGASL